MMIERKGKRRKRMEWRKRLTVQDLDCQQDGLSVPRKGDFHAIQILSNDVANNQHRVEAHLNKVREVCGQSQVLQPLKHLLLPRGHHS